MDAKFLPSQLQSVLLFAGSLDWSTCASSSAEQLPRAKASWHEYRHEARCPREHAGKMPGDCHQHSAVCEASGESMRKASNQDDGVPAAPHVGGPESMGIDKFGLPVAPSDASLLYRNMSVGPKIQCPEPYGQNGGRGRAIRRTASLGDPGSFDQSMGITFGLAVKSPDSMQILHDPVSLPARRSFKNPRAEKLMHP